MGVTSLSTSMHRLAEVDTWVRAYGLSMTRPGAAYMYMDKLRQYTHNAFKPGSRSSVVCCIILWWWGFPDLVYTSHRMYVYASDYLCTCIILI